MLCCGVLCVLRCVLLLLDQNHKEIKFEHGIQACVFTHNLACLHLFVSFCSVLFAYYLWRNLTRLICVLASQVGMSFVKEVVVDASKHLLGRLASVVAKQLLNGQHVTVVRCERIEQTGSRECFCEKDITMCTLFWISTQLYQYHF